MSRSAHQLLTTSQAAELLGIAPGTLRNWRQRRKDGPPFLALSRKAVRYPVHSLLDWAMAQGLRTSTRPPGAELE